MLYTMLGGSLLDVNPALLPHHLRDRPAVVKEMANYFERAYGIEYVFGPEGRLQIWTRIVFPRLLTFVVEFFDYSGVEPRASASSLLLPSPSYPFHTLGSTLQSTSFSTRPLAFNTTSTARSRVIPPIEPSASALIYPTPLIDFPARVPLIGTTEPSEMTSKSLTTPDNFLPILSMYAPASNVCFAAIGDAIDMVTTATSAKKSQEGRRPIRALPAFSRDNRSLHTDQVSSFSFTLLSPLHFKEEVSHSLSIGDDADSVFLDHVSSTSENSSLHAELDGPEDIEYEDNGVSDLDLENVEGDRFAAVLGPWDDTEEDDLVYGQGYSVDEDESSVSGLGVRTTNTTFTLVPVIPAHSLSLSSSSSSTISWLPSNPVVHPNNPSSSVPPTLNLTPAKGMVFDSNDSHEWLVERAISRNPASILLPSEYHVPILLAAEDFLDGWKSTSKVRQDQMEVVLSNMMGKYDMNRFPHNIAF